RVETDKMTLWKEIGIYDLIQLSKNSYTVNSGLMGGALYFWDETSHTFHTPYGMITPTLLDVAAITGLPLLGEEILTTTWSTTGVKYAIDISSTTYQSFILNNKGQDGDPVSDNEHITFLLYWLRGVVFCVRSTQVKVTYLPLAIMLAEGPADSVITEHRLLNLVFSDKLMASHDKMKHFFRAFYHLPEKDHNINLTPFANCQTSLEWLTQSLTPTKDDHCSCDATSEKSTNCQKGEKTTPLTANPPLRKSSSRLVEKKKFNFNYSSRRVKRRLELIEVSTSSNSDDKDDTSNTSNDNFDGPVISQHNEGKNENTSSSDKSVSKFSLEGDVDAHSPSGQLASQVTVAPTISLIVPSTENMMAATSDKPTSKTNANKTPNVVNDLLADLKSLNEAYAYSIDTQKAIVESCSTIQSHLPAEQPYTTPPKTKIVDNSILLPLGQQLSVILSKPVLTLATDPQFKAQFSDIIQTFSTTQHPETIDPLLAHLQK
ncbi:hypothetical protein S245_034518, partial [Arachis hypogaea]